MSRMTDSAERTKRTHLYIARSCLEGKHYRRARAIYGEDEDACGQHRLLKVKVEVLPDGSLEECDELRDRKSRWFKSVEKAMLNKAYHGVACSGVSVRPRRGRPRKTHAEGTSRAGPMTPQKRGRGRPPKRSSVLQAEEGGGIMSKRGRPRKTPVDGTSRAGTVAAPPLKKRGRPPKRRAQPIPTAEFCDNCCQMLLNNFGFNLRGKLLRLEDKAGVAGVDGTVKRARGRPRKVHDAN